MSSASGRAAGSAHTWVSAPVDSSLPLLFGFSFLALQKKRALLKLFSSVPVFFCRQTVEQPSLLEQSSELFPPGTWLYFIVGFLLTEELLLFHGCLAGLRRWGRCGGFLSWFLVKLVFHRSITLRSKISEGLVAAAS